MQHRLLVINSAGPTMRDENLIHSSLDPHKSAPKRAHDRFSRFCTAAHPCAQHRQTDRHTDHATCDICSNRLHLCTTHNRYIKKLRYRRGTARSAMPVEISSTAAQPYEKSHWRSPNVIGITSIRYTIYRFILVVCGNKWRLGLVQFQRLPHLQCTSKLEKSVIFEKIVEVVKPRALSGSRVNIS